MKKFVAMLLLCSCSQEAADRHSLQFQEVKTEIAPIECGHEPQQSILEVNGCGMALFDFNGKF